MPTFEQYDLPWARIKAKRDRITKALIAKGLVPRSNKFHEVLARKMRRGPI